MDIVRLVDFVKSGELFEKIEGDFDQIVSDFDFGNMKNFVKINKILDFKKINLEKKTLFVLDKILPENIEEIFSIKNFTILDMKFGLNSYGNKLNISRFDICDFINLDIDIYEPIDLISLLDNLNRKGNKYIRIDNKDILGNFFDEEIKDIVCMDNYGLSGEAFTIFTTGSMLPEVVRAANILNEDGLFVEVFVLSKLNFDLNKEIKEKLSNTKNLIFILDLLNSDNYEKWIKEKFKDINISFLYPEYEKLSTVLDEYKAEETRFDALGLVERLK